MCQMNVKMSLKDVQLTSGFLCTANCVGGGEILTLVEGKKFVTGRNKAMQKNLSRVKEGGTRR